MSLVLQVSERKPVAIHEAVSVHQVPNEDDCADLIIKKDVPNNSCRNNTVQMKNTPTQWTCEKLLFQHLFSHFRRSRYKKGRSWSSVWIEKTRSWSNKHHVSTVLASCVHRCIYDTYCTYSLQHQLLLFDLVHTLTRCIPHIP